MAVLYRKQKVTLKGKAYGQWFGRAVSLGAVTTRQLSEEIAHSTTVTRSDVMAVLIELFEVMKQHLQNSETVQLDEIGSFKVGFRSVPAKTEKEFTASNVKSFHILYRPFTNFVANGQVSAKGKRKGAYVKSLLEGISVKEWGEKKTTTETTDTSNTQQP